MKYVLPLIFLLFFLSIHATAQQVNDFYVAFSKSPANDTLYIYISVQKHQNISYELMDVEIKEKGADASSKFQISNRFPYGVINDMNVYIYRLPLQIMPGHLYEITLDNKRLCNAGPFKMRKYSVVTVSVHSVMRILATNLFIQ
jgi:hypothetical protein